MGRKKVTTSLGTKCLQLIDHYAVTTGFESRSRVIEEAVFAVTELLGHRRIFAQKAQQLKENPSKEEIMRSLLYIGDILSKYGAVLDRFERFADAPLTQTVAGKKSRALCSSARAGPPCEAAKACETFEKPAKKK